MPDILARIPFLRRPGEKSAPWHEALLIVTVTAFIAAVLIVLYFLLWNLLMHFIGRWRKLSRIYTPTTSPNGNAWIAYGAIGKMLQNTLKFQVNNEGLFVARMQVFDLFNKPLFIPWSAFHNARPGKSYTSDKMTILDIGKPEILSTLLLPRYVLEKSSGSFLLEDLLEINQAPAGQLLHEN